MQNFKTTFVILTVAIVAISVGALKPNSYIYHVFTRPAIGEAFGEQLVTEQAKTNFTQFVDKPYTITYHSFGEDYVKVLPNQPFMQVSGYRQVCVEVAPRTLPSVTTSFDLVMGKISGATLATRIGQLVPVGATIHCFTVEGPEIGLLLHGKPGATDQVKLWVYLTS